MPEARVSILVPNYRTRKLTELCLKLIRRHTDPALAEVIVVDNDSGDDSLNYLRSLSWIRLIERRAQADEPAHLAHARALDLAFEQVDSEFVLSIHTDTLVLKADWLEFLLRPMEDPQVGGVGSWKLEHRPPHRRILKSLETNLRNAWYRMTGSGGRRLEGTPGNPYYLRSHCALFRTALIRDLGLRFSGNDENACKAISLALQQAGYKLHYMDQPSLMRYIEHVDHATMFLNPEKFLATGELHKRHIKRGLARLKRITANLSAEMNS